MPTVLITGAASGIGMACAQRLAAQGQRCVLVDRNRAGLDQVLDSLAPSALGNHLRLAIDLTDASAVAGLRQLVPDLDGVINNAGMSDDRNQALVEQGLQGMQRLRALNVQAPAALVEALMPRLQPHARIVNVASGAGLRAIPWRGAYSPSKAGLIAQSKALAAAHPEWTVTVLSPGFVRTDLVDTLMREGRLRPERALAKIPLGRMAEPVEMAAALCFLVSPAAAALHGQVLAVDGGSSIYGGSQALPVAQHVPVAADAPVDLQICGDMTQAWPLPACEIAPQKAYAACLDISPWHSPSGGLFDSVYAAAVRFAQRYTEQSSLTLLLPVASRTHWRDAGDRAEARMLIQTLACEWGARGLRINALECGDPGAAALQPLVRFMAGAAAQYLTGQVLDVSASVPADRGLH